MTDNETSLLACGVLQDDWVDAERQIEALAKLPAGWDGYGAKPVSPAILSSALALLAHMRDGGGRSLAGYGPPDDVYAMPEGTVILEWRLRAGTIVRMEVEWPGHGECMISYPHDEAEFDKIHWPLLGFQRIARAQCDDTFQMAA